GVVWGLVAAMLFVRAGGWLLASPLPTAVLAGAAGAAMGAYLIPRTFMPLVRKNLARLTARPARACLFSMFAWRSWFMALVMSIGGVALRYSPTPRPLLAAMYVGMGLCLGSGAVLYFRPPRRAGRAGV
ncbi:hypothetical protein KKA85_05255, partial [bacterium]|nr:hypothetical protein [bacterium]